MYKTLCFLMILNCFQNKKAYSNILLNSSAEIVLLFSFT